MVFVVVSNDICPIRTRQCKNLDETFSKLTNKLLEKASCLQLLHYNFNSSRYFQTSSFSTCKFLSGLFVVRYLQLVHTFIWICKTSFSNITLSFGSLVPTCRYILSLGRKLYFLVQKCYFQHS